MKFLVCPNCEQQQEVKQVGDIPYAKDAVYARFILNCDGCNGMFDIFVTHKPQTYITSALKE